MKFYIGATAVLLIFCLGVTNSTLNEHTRSIKGLHYDNTTIILNLESIDRHIQELVKTISAQPTPLPVGSSIDKSPKVANEMPVRRAEVISQ